MSGFLSEYGLFLLELSTVAVIVVVSIVVVLSMAKKSPAQNQLVVENINEVQEHRADAARRKILGRRDVRKLVRDRRKEKKREKDSAAEGAHRKRIYVIDFKGDIHATATASLREEVSAVIELASKEDEVLVRLENAGGAVHEHGLAASQLLRLRARGIKLTVAVDKVAASGGYLMACAADKIIAAPYAILGSIGVLVQMPNFHRLLEQRGVDFEQVTAGRFKRTLTLFGENTDEDRDKVRQDVEEVHELFKQSVKDLRPTVDIDQVATGEIWYGTQALEVNLIDEIGTSDDFLLESGRSADLYKLTFKRQKRFIERVLQGAEAVLHR